MADDSFDPLVWMSDRVADAVDWIHDTFSDPALSRELRADLGVKDDVELTGDLPTGDKIRMRHPDGSVVDPDKAAFDATVAEVKAAYGVLVDFFGHLDLSLEELWDFLFLLGQLGLSESIRARWPVDHEHPPHDRLPQRRRPGGGDAGADRSRARRSRRSTCCAPSTPSAATRACGPTRRSPTSGRWPATPPARRSPCWRRSSDPKIGMRAAYGYEADFGSLTPQSDEIAQGAFTVDVFDKDPAGTAGFDGHAGLTFVWVPSKAAVPATARRPRRPASTSPSAAV